MAAVDYFQSHGELDNAELLRASEKLRTDGLLAVIKQAQAKLAESGIVLTPDAVEKMMVIRKLTASGNWRVVAPLTHTLIFPPIGGKVLPCELAQMATPGSLYLRTP